MQDKHDHVHVQTHYIHDGLSFDMAASASATNSLYINEPTYNNDKTNQKRTVRHSLYAAMHFLHYN